MKPVVVRGPVTSGVARVIVDDTKVIVVTQKSLYMASHDGAGLVQQGRAPNKFMVTIPNAMTGEPETLTVVKAGGCTCGKPWIKKHTPGELLDKQSATELLALFPTHEVVNA